MPIVLPEPHDIESDPRGGQIPVWQCPNCNETKKLEEFGWRKRDDIYPGQDVWHKQSWCKECRR